MFQRNLNKARNSLINMTLHELVVQIARALVDYPDRVRLDSRQEDGKAILRLFVDPKDVGQIIGKDGRIARSLRTIVGAASMKLRYRVSLEIMNRLDAMEQGGNGESMSKTGLPHSEEEPNEA
ncbi:KH domain-containing protein [Acidicapsa ligni]|uniref:KH domain-containing protein n=1 Tax=Acidicapsa ligni TaxID=542300 RepID=UPI0021DFC3F9|nr:KH domain-containing protein [Acidicapsa ligni]